MNFPEETISLALTVLAEGNDKNKAYAALYLSLAEREHPGIATEKLTEHLRYIVSGGHEPVFDFSPNFYFPALAGFVAVANTLPQVCASLSAEDRERLDFLMQCFAVTTASATDDDCAYTSGPGFVGNYNKNWNPNYPISNIPQIVFAASYFGSAEKVNRILADFSYDDYLARMHKYGWSNAYENWERTIDPASILTDDGKGHMTYTVVTSEEDVGADNYGHLGLGLVVGESRVASFTNQRAMLMEGGEVYALTALARISQYVGKPCGSGIGVPAIGKKGYIYRGHPLSDYEGIWNYLLEYNYSGGIVASKEVQNEAGEYLCYVIDGVPSPVEGYPGLMREFRSGKRSSVSYCLHDFLLCEATTAAMDALGIYDKNAEHNQEIQKKIWIGNTDFLHKAEHGYVSYTGTAVRGAPVATYGLEKGGNVYLIWKNYWEENDKNRFTLADFAKENK